MKKVLAMLALAVTMTCPLRAQAASVTDVNLVEEKRLEVSDMTVVDPIGTTITLPDGTVFDPVFYANTYPDVAVAIGTDANLLAQHYIMCGKAEGRLPSAGGTAAPILPQLPVLKTGRGLVITPDNPAYLEMIRAARGIVNAPRLSAKGITVWHETAADEILLEDESVYVKITVVLKNENDLDPDVENHVFHIQAVIDGKRYDRFCLYGPELERWEKANDLGLAYIVGQTPVFPAVVDHIICAEDNTLVVYSEGIGIVNVYAESGIENLVEDDSVMVTVTRMATDADKDATIVDPQVVGYVTKIQ